MSRRVALSADILLCAYLDRAVFCVCAVVESISNVFFIRCRCNDMMLADVRREMDVKSVDLAVNLQLPQ